MTIALYKLYDGHSINNNFVCYEIQLAPELFLSIYSGTVVYNVKPPGIRWFKEVLLG
jgi:hypothetical protein